MDPIKSLYVKSGSKRLEPGENARVCMASLLSSNGRNSAYFDNIRLKLSKHAYFGCAFSPRCQTMKILKIDFVTSSLMNSIWNAQTYIFMR